MEGAGGGISRLMAAGVLVVTGTALIRLLVLGHVSKSHDGPLRRT